MGITFKLTSCEASIKRLTSCLHGVGLVQLSSSPTTIKSGANSSGFFAVNSHDGANAMNALNIGLPLRSSIFWRSEIVFFLSEQIYIFYKIKFSVFYGSNTKKSYPNHISYNN